MANSIFGSHAFTAIVRCDLESTNIVSDEAEKKIAQVAKRVISHLSLSALKKGEGELLFQFIGKVKEIDEQFSGQGRESRTLSTCVYALNVLGMLRTKLDPSEQAIAGHEFILYLAANKDAESLEDPLDLMVRLSDFQKEYLLPALENATNQRQLSSLEPLVDQCILLSKKIMGEKSLGKAAETLEAEQKLLTGYWNAKHVQMQPVYQRLLTYEKRQIGDLSQRGFREERVQKISAFIEEFIKNVNHPLFTRDEKISIFHALKMIQAEFAEHGLEITVPIEKVFYRFLKNDLLRAVEQVKSLDELLALAPLIRKCSKLSKEINHEAIDGQLNGVIQLAKKKRTDFMPLEQEVVVSLKKISEKDRVAIEKLSKEIVDLKPVIGDANAYKFSASFGTYINDSKTKNGSLSMLAAGLRAHVSGKRYFDSPEEIMKLGRDLIKQRSGQCDHMAAAVITKIVEHIQQGGQWDADVELVGNGGHSFVIINRPQGETKNLDHWNGAIIADTWLGVIGVHKNYQNRIPSPKNGIISDPQEVRAFATMFGAAQGDVKILKRFEAQDLHKLAQQTL